MGDECLIHVQTSDQLTQILHALSSGRLSQKLQHGGLKTPLETYTISTYKGIEKTMEIQTNTDQIISFWPPRNGNDYYFSWYFPAPMKPGNISFPLFTMNPPLLWATRSDHKNIRSKHLLSAYWFSVFITWRNLNYKISSFSISKM